MGRAIQSPKKQLAHLSVGEMKGALPKLQRRINDINAIDPAQAVGTYTPEFSAIGQNANATLMEIFGSDSVEYERFKILSIYAGRNSHTREILRNEVIAGYMEGKKRALIKIDSAIKFINEKLVDSQSMSENTSKEEEWISAARALAMLAMREYEGARTICKRAHAGLIKARAIRFINNGRSTDNVDILDEFWCAEG